MRITTMVLGLCLPMAALPSPVYFFRATETPVLADFTPAPALNGWFAEDSPTDAVVYGVEKRESLLSFDKNDGDKGHGHPEPPKVPETSTLTMVLTGIAAVWLGTRRKTA